MAKVTFKSSRKAMEGLAKSPKVQQAMVAHATRRLPAIQASVPKRTGQYAAAIKVEPATVRLAFLRNGAPAERLGAIIHATAPYSASLEWGHGPAIGVHRKVRAAGSKRKLTKVARSGARHPLGKAVALMNGA